MNKKLIEVALPLEVINKASASEKANPFTKNHPRGLHQWWARRPLAACRAVVFASLINDPSSDPARYPTLKAQEDERSRLFGILERLVQWENTTNEGVLEEARAEIRLSTAGSPPALLDPFSGGGAIPLEAQRLGLKAFASDLNPVAVLITKGLIEIPPKFRANPPVHPEARRGVGATGSWLGTAGLSEDIRRYGDWMRSQAAERIGHLYPAATLPSERGGGSASVSTWIWARSVQCPNPACRANAPLVRSFVLSSRKGSEARIEPQVDLVSRTVTFKIATGPGRPIDGTVGRNGARCLVCGSAMPFDHVRAEGRAKRLGTQLIAMVAQGSKGRVFLPPTQRHTDIALGAQAPWLPMSDLPEQALGFRVQAYGITKHSELFTARQLAALATLSDLIAEARRHVIADAKAAGWRDDPEGLEDGGRGAVAYGDAIATYLAFAVDQLARYLCSLTPWNSTNQNVAQVFGRQTMSMVWDYAEANPIEGPLAFSNASEWVAEALAGVPVAGPEGTVTQADAASAGLPTGLVSTDPPYYDNVVGLLLRVAPTLAGRHPPASIPDAAHP